MLPGPVLIANRGEIAIRIARTLHSLGVGSVGVFCDPDAASAHVDAVDLAVRIDSYLEPAEIVAAAELAGAAAVHPGYGFLSESPALAQAVAETGLSWVGPPPAAIELMGDKARAKRLAREAGVPVIPGHGEDDATRERAAEFAAEHGYPVLVKAAAGGGGKGMRVVAAESELEEAMASARREAESAFGDGRLLVERYLERPRHIEVQVLADRHGGFVHLGERECSLQRRHQKVVEEAPSPAIGEAMRERIGDAALSLARACSYEGAGTVEFIAPSSAEEFFFLEMNTRLQVEHPVTELVWGVDLVELQLRVAAGEPLPFAQSELEPSGHAVEARLYAEDPGAGFLPATGTVRRYREPAGAGVRVDSGIRAGAVIGTDYDPLLAKVIAYGADRRSAIDRLDRALGELELLGVANNAAFTRGLLAREEVRSARQDTGLLERLLGELAPEHPAELLAAGALALWLEDTSGTALRPGPWRRSFERFGEVSIAPSAAEGELTLTLAGSGGEQRTWRAAVRAIDDGELSVALDGVVRRFHHVREGSSTWVGQGGRQLELRTETATHADAAAAAGSLEAPMPGTVLSVRAANGDEVEEGETLLVLESMKMELAITAPHAGVVEGLDVGAGERVEPRQVLASVVAAEEGSG